MRSWLKEKVPYPGLVKKVKVEDRILTPVVNHCDVTSWFWSIPTGKFDWLLYQGQFRFFFSNDMVPLKGTPELYVPTMARCPWEVLLATWIVNGYDQWVITPMNPHWSDHYWSILTSGPRGTIQVFGTPTCSMGQKELAIFSCQQLPGNRYISQVKPHKHLPTNFHEFHTIQRFTWQIPKMMALKQQFLSNSYDHFIPHVFFYDIENFENHFWKKKQVCKVLRIPSTARKNHGMF